MRKIVVIFGSRVGFSGTAYLMASFKFTPDDPVAIVTKFGTKSAITRLVYEISRRSLRPTGVFGVGLLNDGR